MSGFTLAFKHSGREMSSRELTGADVVFATCDEASAYGRYLMGPPAYNPKAVNARPADNARVPGLEGFTVTPTEDDPNCLFDPNYKLRWLHALEPT